MNVEVPIGDSGRVIIKRGTKGAVTVESKSGKGPFAENFLNASLF